MNLSERFSSVKFMRFVSLRAEVNCVRFAAEVLFISLQRFALQRGSQAPQCGSRKNCPSRLP